MRKAPLAFALALVLGAFASAFACRKDDGTTPNPNGPIQPSAAVSPPAPSAVQSAK